MSDQPKKSGCIKSGCGTVLFFVITFAVFAALFTPRENLRTNAASSATPTPIPVATPLPLSYVPRAGKIATPHATAAPARTGRKLTNGGFVASPSEELLDKAVRYAVQKDAMAFGQLLRSGLVIELKDGIPVEIMDTKIVRGKIKIRPRGQTMELWTVMEAIRDE